MIRPSSRALIVVGVALLMLMIAGWQYAAERTQLATVFASPPPADLDNFELGEYYFNQRADSNGTYELEKAHAHYLAAVRAAPRRHVTAWYQLGRIDFVQGRLDGAVYKFNKQIEFFGDELPNVYYMLGLTYGYKAMETDDPTDWQQAEAGFQTFMEYAPYAPWPRVDLAWVYFSQGKYEEMLPLLEEGLEHEPDNAWLLNTYGLALMNTGATEEAHKQFTKAHAAASQLTVDDWAAAYSGNNPQEWGAGLAEFRHIIAENMALTAAE